MAASRFCWYVSVLLSHAVSMSFLWRSAELKRDLMFCSAMVEGLLCCVALWLIEVVEECILRGGVFLYRQRKIRFIFISLQKYTWHAQQNILYLPISYNIIQYYKVHSIHISSSLCITQWSGINQIPKPSNTPGSYMPSPMQQMPRYIHTLSFIAVQIPSQDPIPYSISYPRPSDQTSSVLVWSQ